MTKDKVEAVNKILLAGEPENITKPDTNGYVGYEPQHLIDAMNEGFGIGNWGFEELSSETVDNEKATLAIAHIAVWLSGIDFKPAAWGQSRVTRGDIGDAKKGAQTDAIKKALAYFSIGNRAYHGLLDGKKPAPQQRTQPKPVQPKPEDDHIPINAPTPRDLRERHKFLGMQNDWETVKRKVFNRDIIDDELTPEQCVTLNGILERYYQTHKKAS